MKIVVTGHLGFIGTELLKSLPAIGLDIKDGNDILECELPPGDVVIHLAAQPGVVASVKDPYTNARTNILGTIRLLQHYKDAKFIFASSGGTIQETIESPYGLSKYTCEEYIKLLSDNYVILRFPNVYGKGSRSVVDKFLNEDELTIYGDGKTNRIYAHVSDVVNAILKSVEWESNKTYKLGTAQRYSVLEIAQAIGKPRKHRAPRKGEITHLNSQLPNETPNWKPYIDLMNYIKENS
jgi:UDP-glucose 4-epimerase